MSRLGWFELSCTAFEVLISSLYRPCIRTVYSGKVMKENVMRNSSITWKYTDLLSNSVAFSAAQSEELICVSHVRGSTYVCTSSRVVCVTAKSKTTAATIPTLHFMGPCDWRHWDSRSCFRFWGGKRNGMKRELIVSPHTQSMSFKILYWKGPPPASTCE